ncbi:MAG: FAD:protein FMN transferase [Bacteroidales bacterium]|nr:FAD:protein FMN transferase [Bacteroidales bacterium]
MKKSLYHNHFAGMGTRFDLVLPDTDMANGDKVFRQIKAEIDRLEKKLSRFLPDSELTYINQHAANNPVKIDHEWITILEACNKYYISTYSCFDVTLQQDSGKNHNKLSGAYNIVIDKNDATVNFADPGIMIDLGGFGKGYALDRVNDILQLHNVKNALVSFGESSILAIGKHPHGNHWNIGIQHLFKPGENVFVFNLENNNMSTSGMLARNGKLRYRKTALINPVNGKSVEEVRTISVKSVKAIDAEVLSTALYVSPQNRRKKILLNFPESEAIEAIYTNDKKVSIFVLKRS